MMHPHRKLLVLGLNELLAQNLVTLLPSNGTRGCIPVVLAGRPSLVGWSHVSFREFRFDVWWDYDEAQDTDRAGYVRGLPHQPLFPSRILRRVIAAAGAWVERKPDANLQGHGSERVVGTYMRRDARTILDALPDPVPCGFAAEGPIFL